MSGNPNESRRRRDFALPDRARWLWEPGFLGETMGLLAAIAGMAILILAQRVFLHESTVIGLAALIMLDFVGAVVFAYAVNILMGM